jgi:hypothetical protein
VVNLGRKSNGLDILFKIGGSILSAASQAAKDSERAEKQRQREINAQNAELVREYNRDTKNRDRINKEKEKSLKKAELEAKKALAEKVRIEKKVLKERERIQKENDKFQKLVEREKLKQEKLLKAEELKLAKLKDKAEKQKRSELKEKLTAETIQVFFDSEKSFINMPELSSDITLKSIIERSNDDFKMKILKDHESRKLDLDGYLFHGQFNSVLGLHGLEALKESLVKAEYRINNLPNEEFFQIYFRSGVYFVNDFKTDEHYLVLNNWRKFLKNESHLDVSRTEWNVAYLQCLKFKEEYTNYFNWFYSLKLVA